MVESVIRANGYIAELPCFAAGSAVDFKGGVARAGWRAGGTVGDDLVGCFRREQTDPSRAIFASTANVMPARIGSSKPLARTGDSSIVRPIECPVNLQPLLEAPARNAGQRRRTACHIPRMAPNRAQRLVAASFSRNTHCSARGTDQLALWMLGEGNRRKTQCFYPVW